MSVKLDLVDKKLLFELEKNSRISDVKLAKIIGKSKDAVRYRIKRLEEQGVIESWKTWIDFSKLGFRTATLYLNILNLPDKKQKLIDEIKEDPKVYWIGVAEGNWNIGVTYFIRSNQELFEMKNHLLSKYQDLLTDVTITSLVSVSVHEKTFLSKQHSSLITFTENYDNIKLDDISLKLLQELYWNSRANLVDLADKCNTSVDIIRLRMKNLQEQGIIIRYTLHINYQLIGYEFFKASIYLKSFSDSNVKSLFEYGKNSDKIINIVKQIAPWDIEYVVFADNFKDYSKVVSDFTQRFSNIIKKVETAAMIEDIIFPCRKMPI